MTTRTPPDASLTPTSEPDVTGNVVHAGFWRQMAALLLDSLLIMTVSPVVTWLVFLSTMIVPAATRDMSGSVAGMNFTLISMFVAAWLVTVAYHTLFDASVMQGTPGKRALGIKVVDESGARIGLMRALIRSLLQTPPWGIGYLLALFDRRKRGLHDLVAGTRVVDQWAWTASPGLQSTKANRTAAWVGIPVTLAVGLWLAVAPMQRWLDAGGGRHWQDTLIGVGDQPDRPSDVSDDITAPVIATHTEAHGMTWGSGPAQTQTGVSLVSCHGQPFASTRTGSCDAYIGDTACSTTLPVLCLRQDGREPPTESAREIWAGGEIALAPAIAGSAFRSQGDADAYCTVQRGAGWRIAEHHDGKGRGWAFHAAGVVASDTRFWVANNDMPANCWNSKPRPRTDAQFDPGSDDAPQLEARNVHFSGTVRSFDGGCWTDGVCSMEVGNRTITLPSPHPGREPVASGHVDRLPDGQEWVGQRVKVYCSLLRGACSIEGHEDYYIRLLP